MTLRTCKHARGFNAGDRGHACGCMRACARVQNVRVYIRVLGRNDVQNRREAARLVFGANLESDVAAVRYEAVLHDAHEQDGFDVAAAESDDDRAGG